MKSNVVVIMTDDQTQNTINYLGNKDIITPNLDELAKRSISFNNCHIPSGTSGAVCMPSRAMFNTGLQPFSLCNSGQKILPEQPLLGETLKNNGYHTFFTGKWHNGTEGFKRSFNSGDNIFFGGMWDHYNVPMNHYDPSGEYDNKVDFVVNFFNDSNVLTMPANKFNPGVHSTDVVTNSAINFLDSYNEDKPFYLNVAYLAPHDPRVVPKKYLDMYDDINITLDDNMLEKHPFYFGWENERDEQIVPEKLTHEYVQKETRSYYAMITHLDDQIGEILKKLKEKGYDENTIIIFTSDNGLSLGSHGLMGKQNLYEKSIKIPFLISGPDIKRGKICSNFIYLLDVFPTLVDILGLKIDHKLDGISFTRCFKDVDVITRDSLYFAFTYLIRGVKTKDYKLIKYNPKDKGKPCEQLFDLKNDPLELNDVYNNIDYKNIKDKMQKLLLEYKKEWESQGNEFSSEFWNR